MNSIDYKNKLLILIESSNSNQLGIYFSLFLHLMILLFAIGLPDFFKPRPITLPNVIPIEIINVTDTTSIPEKEKIELCISFIKKMSKRGLKPTVNISF